nr:rhodanese-like domain-containing protein [uncultured Blautia sp.]
MRKYNVLLFFGFLLTLFLFTGCNQNEQPESNSYRQVSSKEAAAMMEEETDYIILDVRTPEEYEEKHITGAVNLPNETIGTEEIAQLPDKEQLILVYCRSGNRSKQASKKLTDLGYTNIIEFGGIKDWTGETETGR